MLVVKIEVLIHKRVRQQRRRIVKKMPPHVGLQIINAGVGENPFECLREFWDHHIQAVDLGRAHPGDKCAPLE